MAIGVNKIIIIKTSPPILQEKLFDKEKDILNI